MTEKKVSPFFYVVKGLVRLFYGKMEVVGAENLPQEPVIVVGNHAQMHGPIACELFFPTARYTWCAGEMMAIKEVPAYAYKDFWSYKPKYIRWLYKILSYLIAPLSAFVFTNADTIPVYHDARLLSTFKRTVKALADGRSVVVFPEHDVPKNHIIFEFQDKFIDIARLYHKRTGQAVCFVPMYLAPDLRQMHLGKPVRFSPDAPMDQERQRICEYLMTEITDMAVKLPRHRVVPYRNVAKKLYPVNIPQEVTQDEKTGG